ncbi:WD repeat-containing protein 47 isoform X2 [Maniola hyperantus]|uniref:WD repeat-containing protein 47 isoform X2 n=2 Tax=Aphantopus hyperantus TaxID=2795564 RepID=UPI0015688EA9|nr:WD repeat-containing protein 47 isoform X1 [Maniola hyperantus]
MTAVKKAIAMRQLDSMFGTMTLEGEGRHSPLVSSTIEHDPHCDVHGRCSTPYRSSLYLHSRESTPGFRESVSPTNGLIIRRRGSLVVPGSPSRDIEHPSTFPSTLRRDRHSPSQTPPRRDTPSPTQRYSSKRHSMGSFPNLSRSNIVNYNRRDSLNSTGIRDMKRDYVGSLNSLSRKSSIDTKKSSTDSLDMWQSTWDIDRHKSNSSLASDERLSCGHNKQKVLRNGQSAQKNMPKPVSSMAEVDSSKPTFKPITMLEDLQAVRCAEFHPNGKLYAVGSNTKTLRICTYPKMDEINWDDVKEGASPPTVLLKRTKHHKGSIYCLAWSPAGDLLATASNDKTVKLMRFNSHTCNLEGQEMELSMHDGTVRDICFIEDTSNKTSLLVSGGAGDCKIYVTDCATGKPFQSLAGHSGHVLSLYNWGGAMFVSGSQDKTVRFWDLRVGGCVNVIPNKTSAVTSLAVESSGRLLVSGYEDGFCSMHDVRAARPLQRFGLHSSDVRSVRFSPGAYYLLTAGYDGLVVLTDVQGDLTSPLPSVLVARHSDKVISSRWHPEDFSFLSTSADKTAVLWTIPPV